MAHPLKLATALLVIFAIAMPLDGSAQSNTAQDTVDVTHLMDAYHQAVVTHDGARLATFFVPEGGAWFH
jgi:hypothetical protein